MKNSTERQKNNQHGYALITVLIMMVMLGIIGGTIVHMVLSSSNNVLITQDDIMAKVKAENVLNKLQVMADQAVQDINLNISTLTIPEIEAQIEAFITKYNNAPGNPTPYTVTRSDWVTDGVAMFSDKIRISTTAVVNGRRRTYSKTLLISTVPEQFDDAVVADQKLVLNGPVHIKGNTAVVNGDLSVNTGLADSPDLLAYVIKYLKIPYPSIFGSLYVKNQMKFPVSTNNFWGISFDSVDWHTAADSLISSYFAKAPSKSTTPPKVEPINIKQIIDNHNTPPDTSSFATSKDANYTVTGAEKMDGNLLVKKNLILTPNSSLVVNGNLVIQDSAFMLRNSSLTVKQGNIFIAGTAKLTGSITLDPGHSIYVDGYQHIFQNNGHSEKSPDDSWSSGKKHDGADTDRFKPCNVFDKYHHYHYCYYSFKDRQSEHNSHINLQDYDNLANHSWYFRDQTDHDYRKNVENWIGEDESVGASDAKDYQDDTWHKWSHTDNSNGYRNDFTDSKWWSSWNDAEGFTHWGFLNHDITGIYNLNLKGVLYANNHVVLGGNVHANASIYAQLDSSIIGMNDTSTDDTLAFFCDGSLTMAYNNVSSDTPLDLNAYLYSNQDLSLYGIISNLHISGGLYGKTVSLTALRSSELDNLSKWSNSWFPPDKETKSENSANASDSRLTIQTKPGLIENPPTGLPSIKQVQIKVLDSSFQ